MAISTIIFDFGGVLYKMPDLRRINRWTKLLGLDNNPEIIEMLTNPNESEWVNEVCLGKISEDQAWAMMRSEWGIKSQLFQWLKRRSYKQRNLNRKLLDYIDSLRPKYQLAILSNAGDKSRELMVDVFHLDDYVEEIIISAEEGVIKPDQRIYQIAMDRLQTKPSETIFVDDYHKNVKAAQEFGINAVHFTENDQAIQTIREILRDEG